MDEGSARAWVRQHAKPCPCCGAALVMRIEGGPEVAAAIRALAAAQATAILVPVEDAEGDLVKADLRPVAPVGGRIDGEG